MNGRIKERHFPILDPRAHDLDKIADFAYDEFPGNRESERLPMRIEWFYMLRDGLLGSLNTSGEFTSSNPKTKDRDRNPIVARIAFWTDEETNKININTAPERLPRTKPFAATEEGKRYAQIQPATNKVQRYPGHPATTCLSSIFYPGKYVDGTATPSSPSLSFAPSPISRPRCALAGQKMGPEKRAPQSSSTSIASTFPLMTPSSTSIATIRRIS